MYRKTGWGFAFLALFTALCIWLLTSTRFNLGIDLRGGTELRYKLDLSTIPEDPTSVANEVKDIISRRLDLYGLKEIRIAIEGTDQMVVTLPGGDEEATETIIRQVEQAGNLNFQLVVDSPDAAARMEEYRAQEREYRSRLRAWAEEQRAWEERRTANPSLQEPAPVEPKAPDFVVRPLMERVELDPGNPDGPTEWRKLRDVVLDNRPENVVSGRLIESAAPSMDPDTGRAVVAFTMKGEGASRFGDLTGNNQGRQLAIVLDDQVVQAPNIQSRITTAGQITGYTDSEVRSVVTILRGGSLPTKPMLLSRNQVGSTFGEKSIQDGLRSVVIGLAAVMVIIAAYYLFGGLVANFALVFNTIVVLAFVVCFRQTLTLPGIAGILLTIGMAVDANILIFERVREERNRGKSLVQALTVGYQRAFSVIFDSNLTTIITGFVLLNFGTGPVKGFAVTLIAGICISFVSALFVTRLLISFALNIGVLKQFKMLQAFETPSIRFTAVQKPFLLGSIALIVVTWAVLLPRGKANYGIDFTGGARVQMALAKPVPRAEFETEIRTLADEKPALFRDWSLQELAVEGEESGTNYVLLTRAGDDEKESTATQQEDAERVRDELENRLESQALLLPESFESFSWADTGTQSQLSFLVNVRSMGEVRTTDAIRDEVNAAIESNATLSAKPDAGFDGVRVESIALVKEKTDTVPATQYRVTLTPYTAPLATELDAAAPSRVQVESAIRSVFRSEAMSNLALSDPFPTVSTVGRVVSSNLQGKAIVAFFISILGIIFYVSLRFEFMFGLAAITALVHDVLIAIGMLAFVDFLFGDSYSLKINLPEVAALLTVVGYSINDTIVVFDRIRENLKLLGARKASWTEVTDLSINQTLSRTLWTSATTLITVLSLLVLGGEAVRGFAFVLFIGVIVGTYSSVFVASPILLLLHNRAEKRRAAATAA